MQGDSMQGNARQCDATVRDTQYRASSRAHSVTSRHWENRKAYSKIHHNTTHLHRLRTRDNSYAPHREHHHLPETCCTLAVIVVPYEDINREAHLRTKALSLTLLGRVPVRTVLSIVYCISNKQTCIEHCDYCCSFRIFRVPTSLRDNGIWNSAPKYIFRR
jgi:hypothetical protein